ncbi:MAG: UDP-N-acetylmuramate dehydrogenase [Actinomycetota bacterium]
MNLSPLADQLGAAGFRGRCIPNLSLSRFTTYRLGGPAALYVEPESADDLRLLGEAMSAREDRTSIPVLVLGRGSNLVISDDGFPGIVVRLGASFSWIEPWDDVGAHGLVSGSSTTMPRLANWAARRGLSGFEWMISIPGSVGGGVKMNAGAHGGEFADVLQRVTLWRLDRMAVEEVDASDLGYSYRRSGLTDNDLVLEARFTGTRDAPDAILDRMERYRKHRAATQPGALQNAGSVFKNPEGDSAGRLVEAAGLKGFSVGGAHVSTLHANFFIASEGAKAQDVKDLVEAVRAKVRATFGIELEPEIRFVGHFDVNER